MESATTRVQQDDQGAYVILPEGIWFGVDVEVEITRLGDIITIRRMPKQEDNLD